MEDQIEKIKNKVDMVSLVGRYVSLKKAGKHHKGCCPFHAERTPSFVVSPDLGMFKCFGCGIGGDSIKFLMEIEGLEFREALERLAESVGIKLEYQRQDQYDERKVLFEVMSLASEYYKYLLKSHAVGEKARQYLLERKMNDKLVEKFGLGYASENWDSLTKYLVDKKKYDPKILIKLGLANERNGGGYYDRFRDRLMFPLLDSGGKVVGFSGRILPGSASKEEAKYINTQETVIYHKSKNLFGFYQAKDAIRESKRVVLVEGEFDMMSSYASGVGETVAIKGSALTEMQIEMMARLADKIIFALDNDGAGEASIKRSVDLVEKRGMNIKVALLAGGKDPDEICRKDPKQWVRIVNKSVEVYQWIMDKSLSREYESEIEKVREVSKEVMPYINKIESNIVKDKWMSKLADALGVDKDMVMKESQRIRVEVPVEKAKVDQVDSKLQEWERRVVAGMSGMGKQDYEEWKKYLSVLGAETASRKLISFLVERGGLTPDDKIPDELNEEYGYAVMKYGELEIDRKGLDRLYLGLVRDTIEEKKQKLTTEIDELEKKQDESGVEGKMAEYMKLNKKYVEISLLF
jgi:DNA primase